MFDVAPSELLIVAAVAVVLIGPKDLPRAMRFVGRCASRVRVCRRSLTLHMEQFMAEAEGERPGTETAGIPHIPAPHLRPADTPPPPPPAAAEGEAPPRAVAA